MAAFNTALLHSLKYAGQDVYGLVLSSSVEPEACIPLCHTPCVSAPLLRTALSILDQIEGMKIVGIYYSSNNLEDKGISPVAKWIHTELSSTLKSAAILIWRYSEVEISTGNLSKCPFVPYRVDGDKEVIQDAATTPLDATRFKECASRHEYVNIHDFEDFLADSSREWIRI